MPTVVNKDGLGPGPEPHYDVSRRLSLNSFVITPSDTAELPVAISRINCGGAGTVSLVDVFGEVVSFTVVAGQTLEHVTKKVMATGTSATPLTGMV